MKVPGGVDDKRGRECDGGGREGRDGGGESVLSGIGEGEIDEVEFSII